MPLAPHSLLVLAPRSPLAPLPVGLVAGLKLLAFVGVCRVDIPVLACGLDERPHLSRRLSIFPPV